MKRLSLIIIPISLLFLGVFVFTGSKDVEAANGDRASYALDPWTFWQTGVTTDDWNRWELSAFERVEMRDNATDIANPIYNNDPTPTNPNMSPRIYEGQWFAHSAPTTHKKDQERTVVTKGVAHGYVAKIESNGWSGKWIPDPTEPDPMTDPPKWGETTTYQETTSFVPYLMDNNPYTVRCWTTARNLKKNRTYTFTFDAYIGDDCTYADPSWKMEEHNNQPAPRIKATNKYAKIVGTNESGTILFVRYLDITQTKKTFKFNFDMDSSHSSVKVEMMYGSFLLEGPIIKHEEVVWGGSVYIENCDIIQGNLNEPETTTAARHGGGGGYDEWYEEPEKITGVKAKSKAKKSITLSWKKEENSTRYQYNYALKKNFKGGKKKYTTKSKVTIKKLKRKKTYYLRVRGMNDDYTGAWSAKKKCKVK